MKIHNKTLIILNFAVPLLAGAVFYYLFSPDAVFVKVIDGITGRGVHFPGALRTNGVLRFVRFYLLDALWAYALVFALCFILNNNTAKLWGILGMAFALSASMEILQLTPLAEGTFDFWDILTEALSEVLAVFIIKKLLRRQ